MNSNLNYHHSRLVDYHCHLLPEIDDGARDMEESLDMALCLSNAGFTTVCCTPHMIKGSYENSSSEIKARIYELQHRISLLSIPLKLVAGTEYCLDEYLLQLLNDPLPLGDTRLLLIEIPSQVPVRFVKEICYKIKSNGYIPLIAHPERCQLLNDRPERENRKKWKNLLSISNFTAHNLSGEETPLLDYLQEIGCQFQGNLGSFAGIYGEKVKNKALAFLKNGIYDCFGSDAHSAVHLDNQLSLGLKTVNIGAVV